MATVEIQSGRFPDLQSLSSDIKPAAENGVVLHIVDTGDVYIRHEGDWVKDLRKARAIKDAQSL